MAYNGWKNYSTWSVALWFDNDQGLNGMIVERIDECLAEGMTKGEARREVMELIENVVSEMYGDCYDAVEGIWGGFATQLLLSDPDILDIDYYSVADSFLEDYDDRMSESIRSTMTAAYNKGKAGVQKATAKTKAGVQKAKAKAKTKSGNAPPKKTAPKSASTRSAKPKAPAKKGRC